MIPKLKDLLERTGSWPEAAQNELADILEKMESELGGAYVATREELAAIDAADTAGLASDKDVEAAFRSFHRP